LNDDLLTRGFAMNEEGGILKVPCCIQHSSVAHWINCVRNVHGHICLLSTSRQACTLSQSLCQRRQLSGFVQSDVSAAGKSFQAYSCFMTVRPANIVTCTTLGHDRTVHAVSLQCACHILLAADSSFTWSGLCWTQHYRLQ